MAPASEMAPGLRMPRRRGSRIEREGGFTLIELIIALVILVIVLGMTYQILENCLRTERFVEREALPEQIGHALLTLIRKDLEGALYRNLGTDRVFQVTDGGSGEGARDEIQLYSSREPTPEEDPEGQGLPSPDGALRTITAVSYFLKENSQGLFTLFRRENVGQGGGDPFQSGGGISYEIYDKVVSLSIHCFDPILELEGGEPWVESWDSSQRLLEEAEMEEAQAEEAEGIPTVSGSTAPGAGAGGVTDPEMEEGVLPPAAVPLAVRVEVAILAGDETGIFRGKDGAPMIPRVFSTVVPILTAQRIPLTQEEPLDEESTGVPTGSNTDGSSQKSGDSSKKPSSSGNAR